MATLPALASEAQAFGPGRIIDEPTHVGVISVADPGPVVAAPEAAPIAAPAAADVNPDSPADGLALGQRNGKILVDRLIQSTVGHGGCAAIPHLDAALIRVAHSIRPPTGHDDAFTVAFIEGYLKAIRDGERLARKGCSALTHHSGAFAGQLYGELICTVTTLSLDLAQKVEVVPLYDGWSGGSAEVIDSCRESLQLTLESCAGEEAATALTAQVDLSCRD
ncbi:MAG TPA: hypothetical protein VL588_12075 [Bdellovibrionota bacterium]|nr:hypothetical protein [Bdellovibrionota bacterium]